MNTQAPIAYAGFDRLYIAGEWRIGRSKRTIRDTNPFNDEALTVIQGASVEDVDDAFCEAASAQVKWAELLPRERAEFLLAAARIFDDRFEEMKQWVIREAGATHFWANQICRHAAVCCSEAACYAQGAAGVILPSLIRNQSSHDYRKPVGVIAVMTSWNSPINLTIRAVARALALGNAVVLKPASETLIAGALLHAKVFEEVGLPKGLFNTVIGLSEIGKERFTSIDKEEDGGMSIFGHFHSDQWGDFKTYFKFHLASDGKFDRLDIGQANY